MNKSLCTFTLFRLATRKVFVCNTFSLIKLYSHCRQEAFKRAVSNAKSKAQCISQTIGVQLGAALEVLELSQDEIHSHSSRVVTGVEEGETEPNVPIPTREASSRILNNQKLTYTSQVSVVFEAQPLRCGSHKKYNHKH